MAWERFPTGDNVADVAIAKVLMTRHLATNGGQVEVMRQDMDESAEIEFDYELRPGFVIALRRRPGR